MSLNPGYSVADVCEMSLKMSLKNSGAVTHYTMLELADRFKLMNLAFDQEDYRVDNNLEIIDSPVEKDS